MGAIETSKKFFEKAASTLGDYKSLSTQTIGDGYLDAMESGDKGLADAYAGAILLRFWPSLLKWRVTCASLNLTEEDLVSALVEALIRVRRFSAPKWREVDGPMHGDPKAFEKAMNTCIFSLRGYLYQTKNYDNHKANTQTYSIDALNETEGDMAANMLGLTTEIGVNTNIKLLVESFLNKGKTLEAFVIDGIVNGDSFKETIEKKTMKGEEGEEDYEYTQVEEEFNPRMLVAHLNSIDNSYIDWFEKTYDVKDTNMLEEKLSKANSTKWYRALETVKETIKQTPSLMSYLTGN